MNYPPEHQRVSSTAFPNGDVIEYQNGMPQYQLLPSNHPEVTDMRRRRASNTVKTRKLKIA